MTPRRAALLVAATVALVGVFAAGCGAPAPDAVALPLPRALTVDCAAPPEDMQAALWVSGQDAPCPLDVDLSAGTAGGACAVTPGRVRRLTLDYFVERPVVGGTLRIVLAQAQREIDLAAPEAQEVEARFSEEDVRVTGCLDMSADSFEGRALVRFDGADRPVCDLDASCGGDEQPACANLGEVCAGGDPLAP